MVKSPSHIKKYLFILCCFSGSAFADSVPKEHALTDIQQGMDTFTVQQLLGEPDRSYTYKAGKRHIPFASTWANDAYQQLWVYIGKGSIVFSYRKYTDSYSVEKINHKPSQQ